MPTLSRVAAVEAAVTEGTWAWAEDNRAAIAAHWAARLAERPAMFDGPVLIVARHDLEGDVLRAAFLRVRFSQLVAYRDFGAPDPSVANGFAAAAVRTPEGAYLLGEMNRHTANAGQVYFPCGTPDLSDVGPGGRIDLETSALRELEEETGLVGADYRLGQGWTIVIEDGFLGFIKPVEALASGKALRGRILARLAREAEPELSDIVLVRDGSGIDPARMPSYLRTYLSDAFAQR